MKYRLAYVINNLNLGGAEKLLLATIKKLNREKYDVTVFSMLAGDQLLQDFQESGAKIICLGMKNKRDLTGFWKLYRAFKSNKTQIVHTHLLEADIWGRFAALLAKVPVIVSTQHSVDAWKKHPQRMRAKMRLWLNKIATRHSTGVIAVSETVKEFLIKYENICPEKIYVLKNGIEINNNIKALSSENDRALKTIGSMGRLFEEKGFEYLLRAFQQVRARKPKISLVIAGDGPLRASLKKLAQDLNISDNVTFLGNITDIAAFLKRIDVFVLSSIQEGIPLALLEAMAAVKPVIATTVGGIPEVIEHGTDGMLVEATNVNALKNAILSMLNDKKKAKKLGKKARCKALEEFNLDETVKALDVLYDTLWA